MTTASVAVEIPQSLYHRLEQTATRLQKPIESLVVETLQAALPQVDDIPEQIRAEISDLDALDSSVLQKITDEEMAAEDQQTLESLLDTQSIRSLTEAESDRLAELRMEYGRVLLRKARAFALLAERGQPLPAE